jgi:hypothetical protein
MSRHLGTRRRFEAPELTPMSLLTEEMMKEPIMPKIIEEEVTEIHCHECNGYIKFVLDKTKNGNHVLNCPKCGHEHCRVVKDGVVTGDRWESRNKVSPPQPISPNPVTGVAQQIQQQQQQYSQQWGTYVYQMSMTNYSTYGIETAGTCGCNDPFIKDAWMNTDISTSIYNTPISAMP